jgi:phosphomannomutase
LPQYHIAKGKIELGNRSPDAALHRIQRGAANEATINTDDGLRIDYPEYWVHLRKSNTEPIVRVIAEARTMARASEVVNDFTRRILQTEA